LSGVCLHQYQIIDIKSAMEQKQFSLNLTFLPLVCE